MDNKVVHTIARAARDVGLRAVRFNFRGVGSSAGRHDEGRGEIDDLLAVIAGCARHSPGRGLALAGFSFGAWVAASAVFRLPIPPAALLLVAPPVHYLGFDALVRFDLPVLVCQGDDDDVVDPEAVHDWCASRRPSLAVRDFHTGHFFHGCLPALKEETGRWLGATLSPGRGGQ